MSGRAAGKVAIVTGAASGIGRMSAIRLAQEGAKLAIADLNVSDGQSAAREIADAGGEAFFVEHDVTNENHWKAVIAAVLARFGRLDVIVNCAGISISHSVEDTTVDEWDKIMSVNADGVFLGTKFAIDAMKKNGPAGGSISNISSAYGMIRGSLQRSLLHKQGRGNEFHQVGRPSLRQVGIQHPGQLGPSGRRAHGDDRG